MSSSLFFDSSVSFSSLPLDRRLFKALARQRLVYPSLIQAKVIPIALQGSDMLVKARTGAGKTLAFAIPVVQNLLVRLAAADERQRTEGIQAIILVPSKELCEQAKKQIEPLLYFCSELLSLLSLTPDVPQAVQAPLLKEKPDIVIATPARLLEYMKAGIVDVKESLQMLVIDEADLLLNFGYESDVRDLLDYLPKYHQSLLMSATLSPEVEALKALVLHSPAVVKLEENSPGDGENLSQFYLLSSSKDKFLLIYALLKLKLIQGKVLFYTNSDETSFRLKLFLELFSIRTAVLNGHLPFNSRSNIIQQFNRGVFDYLIATDEAVEEHNASKEEPGQEDKEAPAAKPLPVEVIVEQSVKDEGDEEEDLPLTNDVFEEEELPEHKKRKSRREFVSSRGLDFHDVSAVINFDFPLTVKSYIHRIGRTARAGKLGTALSLVAPTEETRLAMVIEQQVKETTSVDLNGEAALKCLEFNLADIEGFRYRVEDVSRAVTKAAVREAQLKDIKMELINSEKLKAHFEDNPRELDLLKHDKVLRPAKVQPHLKHVPKYLLPANLQVQATNQGAIIASVGANTRPSKRKVDAFNKKHGHATSATQRKKAKQAQDPLHNFGAPKASINVAAPRDDDDDNGGGGGAGGSRGAKHAKGGHSGVKLSNSKVGLYESSAGRNRWKKKHDVGKGTQKKNRKK